MREIFEIDKDLVTNESRISKKNKPQSSVKGKVTVSLYDNGNKTREVLTENLVLDWNKAEAFSQYYMNRIGSNSTNAIITNPAQYLLLTDDEGEENASKPTFTTGTNIIGFAQRKTTYSGDSITQGTYNSAESSVYVNDEGNLVVHEVYDFPTHACNGTIKSLAWSPSNANNFTLFTVLRDYSWGQSLGSTCYLDPSTKNVHHLYHGRYSIHKFNTDSKTEYQLLTPSGNNISYDNANHFGNVTSLNNVEVVTLKTGGTNEVPTDNFCYGRYENVIARNAKPVEWIDPVPFPTLTLDGVTYARAYYALYNRHIYIYAANNSSYDYAVFKIDLEGNIIASRKINTPEKVPYTLVGFSMFGKDISVWIRKNSDSNDSGVNLTLNEKLEVVGENEENIQGMGNQYKSALYGLKNTYFDLHAWGDPSYVRLKKPIKTTYLKLSSPVTKTNTNTMKVQYDFVIELKNVITEIG